VVSINVAFPPDQTPVPIACRDNDNLPPHVKGEITWLNHNTRTVQKSITTGYYLPQEITPSHRPEPVEFINNSWYALEISTRDNLCYTRNDQQIFPNNSVGAGYWNVTDPQHPEYQPQSRTISRSSFRFTPGTFDSGDSSEGSSTASAHSAVSIQSIHEPNSPAIETPAVSLDSITASFTPINVEPPTENPDIDMSANVTTVAPVHTPSSNGLKGTAPAVFTGD
jgi:hypothetical protein